MELIEMRDKKINIKLQKYVYQRKSTEIMHMIVDEHMNMSKADIMRMLIELRRVCNLEVFYPLKQAYNYTKESNEIDNENYLHNKDIFDSVKIENK